jgi:hypothetical protein
MQYAGRFSFATFRGSSLCIPRLRLSGEIKGDPGVHFEPRVKWNTTKSGKQTKS